MCSNLATAGEIFTDPTEVHTDFKAHQLAFDLPKDQIARTEYKSDEFYAVILKSSAQCQISEDDRLEAQSYFPANKVFVKRFECGEEDNIDFISYTNINANYNFMAVYAGSTLQQAEDFIKISNAVKYYKGANIRKMQALYVYP